MTLVLEAATRVVDGQTWIHEVDLTLARGSLNVLLGQTLAGKTSLMRLMAGLDKPSRGRVLFDGRDVTGTRVQDRNVAMVYQQFINYPSLTVFENIASPLRVQGKSRAEIDQAVKKAADLLRLGPYLRRTPLELSGGQQQRTAIARALVKGADLVLLDEPLANLDYKLREELREELPRIFAESGAIFVYATTEPTEALLLGGNTATLHQGRITQFGPTVEVYRQPLDRRTAEVFSDPPMNFAAVRVARGHVRIGTGREVPAVGPIASLQKGEYDLGFRPNHVTLAPGPDSMAIEGEVRVAEITGSESFIHVDVGGDRWIALAPGVHELHPGTKLTLHLDPRRFFVFDRGGRLVAGPELARG